MDSDQDSDYRTFACDIEPPGSLSSIRLLAYVTKIEWYLNICYIREKNVLRLK